METQTQLLKEILGALNYLNEQITKTEPILLSRSSAAHLLDCSIKTIDRLTREGILTAYRLKGRVVYKRQDIINAVSCLEEN